ILGGSLSQQEKTKALLTKIVNSFSAKAEMGSPMISMYLLNNPDHYTSHKYVPIYWPIFVREAKSAWLEEDKTE
ncbi:hypothetical protein BDZ94DRAFT_1123768, partial [Collybia nuda]